jgi:tricorn protease
VYSVPAVGGIPTPLAIPAAQHAAMNADGTRIAYVSTSAEWQHWYRYVGGEADDIYVTDGKGKEFTRLTDDKGIDTTPVWVGKDIYFVSERSGNGNLWKLDPATKAATQVTRFADYTVRYPATDGKRVVMEYGNGIALFDPATGKTEPLSFVLRSDRIHALPRVLTVPAGQAEMALGPTGKRLLCAYRGQIVSVPVESGDARVVANAPAARAQYPSWSPDGKRLAYVSDKGGEEQVWIAAAGQAGDTTAPRTVTKDHTGPLGRIVWSPDNRHLLTSDREMRILLVDTETGATTTVYQGKFGGSYDTSPTEYQFSPDGKWIAYTAVEAGWTPRAFLYEVATKKSLPLTPPNVQSYAPVFEPSGKYLLYFSNRQIDPRDDYTVHFFGVRDSTN